MKTDVSKFSELGKYYLSEFEWFDGEEYITFNLVGIDMLYCHITGVALSEA